MTPVGLLATALLLGLYVLLAGAYALAYTLARLKHWRGLTGASAALFALHCAVAAAIVLWSALGPGWKALLLASSAAIFAIPPLTWRYLERTHATWRISA